MRLTGSPGKPTSVIRLLMKVRCSIPAIRSSRAKTASPQGGKHCTLHMAALRSLARSRRP
jgi:hypothetical protein